MIEDRGLYSNDGAKKWGFTQNLPGTSKIPGLITFSLSGGPESDFAEITPTSKTPPQRFICN